ncbi:protein of unknown function [Candidatus Nitrosocosmicus franklandus]|uniref:Uncharacterized protein n=1 Tax=Candidatus Nitrosocosmicus franklandianus TaxID=1798806 RepID=A0A484I6S0_9ARCH|nr:protein of unknown function [Candidatus Nitrosocosmicus franklandus]
MKNDFEFNDNTGLMKKSVIDSSIILTNLLNKTSIIDYNLSHLIKTDY